MARWRPVIERHTHFSARYAVNARTLDDGVDRRIVGMQLDGVEPYSSRIGAARHGAIDTPLVDGDVYDLIFDDDGAGEIADVVSLNVTNGLVQVTLHHLQIFEHHDARARVKDPCKVADGRIE